MTKVSWGRGLEQYRGMVDRVWINKDDPNFVDIDLDKFADSVTTLNVGGPRKVRIDRDYRGFKVSLDGKPHGCVAWWCWKYNEIIEDETVLSARGNIGNGGWSREAATTEYVEDFDVAMAKALELAHLPKRANVTYEPGKPITKKIADECVYAAFAYGTSTVDDLRARAEQLGDKAHELPRGVQGFYLSVEDDADVKLGAGDVVFLNDWGRINGAIKNGEAYELTAS